MLPIISLGILRIFLGPIAPRLLKYDAIHGTYGGAQGAARAFFRQNSMQMLAGSGNGVNGTSMRTATAADAMFRNDFRRGKWNFMPVFGV